jgi:hypothetical protein
MPRHPPLALSSLSIKLDQTTKVLLRILEILPRLFPNWCGGGQTAGAPGLPRGKLKDELYSTIQLSKITSEVGSQRTEDRIISAFGV